MSKRHDRQLALYAQLGQVIGTQVRSMHPVITHKIEHEITYGLKPKPLRVDAIVLNDMGERWSLPGFNIMPGMRHYQLPHFPIQWLVRSYGNEELNASLAALGQASI